jgi:GcrA cell cycle regulator
MDWTEERIETLRRLSLQGMTARQIAEHLGGVSRNAVIGKLNRLDRERKAPSAAKPVTAKVVRIRDAAPAPAPRPRLSPPPAQPRAPIRCEETRGAATFLTLEAHMCRWPIGDPCGADFSFCGQPAQGRSYCSQHASQAYRRVSPSRQDMTRQLRNVLAS